MASTGKEKADSTAVWYFVAATFIVTIPNLFFGGIPLIVRILILVVGIALMAAGFVQWRRESAARGHSAARHDDSPSAER